SPAIRRTSSAGSPPPSPIRRRSSASAPQAGGTRWPSAPGRSSSRGTTTSTPLRSSAGRASRGRGRAPPCAHEARMRRVLVLTSHHPSRREPARAVYGYYTYQALARYCDIRFLSPVAWWTRARWPADLVRARRERWGDLEIEYPAYWSLPGAPPLHGLALAASLARRVSALHRVA